jgi:hypothetical protein
MKTRSISHGYWRTSCDGSERRGEGAGKAMVRTRRWCGQGDGAGKAMVRARRNQEADGNVGEENKR